MTIPFGGLDLGTPDGLIMGTQKESAYDDSIGANPNGVPFVRLQQRNASGIASRSTVAADKSRFRVLTSRKAKRQRKLVTSPVCDSYNQRVFLEMVTVSRIVAAPLDFSVA